MARSACSIREGHVTIHKRQCPEADRLKTADGNHLLAAQWDTHRQLRFPAVLSVDGIDGVGVLLSIATVLSQKLNVNMRSLNIEAHDGIFHGEMFKDLYKKFNLEPKNLSRTLEDAGTCAVIFPVISFTGNRSADRPPDELVGQIAPMEPVHT